MVTLGNAFVNDRGAYEIAEMDDDYYNSVPSGTPVVFLGVTLDDDDAIIVLADGRMGWVFRDEVEAI